MSDNLNLQTFPSDECKALAMLYVQNQDLTGLTPEQLLDMYHYAYDKIRIRRKLTYSERRSVGWSAK